ncbi:hypothetical protein C8J57DRAFT_1585286 [Mycena rebaudengoi]|nr:hypothetical protein C8J57DRAFT_1585286 [Mycena rebaudengoi]
MSLNLPDEGPDVIYSSIDTRKQIVSIVNSTWDTGIAVGMEVLPSTIAPNSTTYHTDTRLATIRHVKNTPILFVWMKVADARLFTTPKSAAYAVGFFIPSDAPFHVADLAFLLLRFQDFHIRDSDYERFNIVSLSYHIGIGGSYGLLLYDNNLRHAFRKARTNARRDPAKYQSSEFGHPISTWPLDNESATVGTAQNAIGASVKLHSTSQSPTPLNFDVPPCSSCTVIIKLFFSAHKFLRSLFHEEGPVLLDKDPNNNLETVPASINNPVQQHRGSPHIAIPIPANHTDLLFEFEFDPYSVSDDGGSKDDDDDNIPPLENPITGSLH